MKGHLGFRCRACLRPGSPQNLRQVGVGSVFSLYSATVEWDAPADSGSGSLTAYRVEMRSSSFPYDWSPVVTVPATQTSASLTWCLESGVIRVVAQNRCGWGAPSNQFSSWNFSDSSTRLYTGSTTISIPCYCTSFKAWAVGPGGSADAGGGAGGLGWKTWVVDRSADNPVISINSQFRSADGHAQITYRGQTLRSNSGGFLGSSSGGDGGATGGGGGQTVNGKDWAFLTGFGWNTRWYWGGGLVGAGDSYYDRAVDPCMRFAIKASQNGGVLEAAAACGLKTVEDCGAVGAFGSGGIKVPMPPGDYSANLYYQPGYGGGGFDENCPGGPGCVILDFAP